MTYVLVQLASSTLLSDVGRSNPGRNRFDRDSTDYWPRKAAKDLIRPANHYPGLSKLVSVSCDATLGVSRRHPYSAGRQSPTVVVLNPMPHVYGSLGAMDLAQRRPASADSESSWPESSVRSARLRMEPGLLCSANLQNAVLAVCELDE